MRKYLSVVGLFLCLYANAQLPEDALRNSWTTPSGTARQQAIGGAMGSIGGDLTAGYVNPAGLALYKTNEIVLSPGWQLFNTTRSGYLGNNVSGPAVNHFSL